MRFAGLALLGMGIVHLWWARVLIVDSQHMGSPLRMHGDHFVNRLPAEHRSTMEGMVELGRLGFSLLSDSFWIFLTSGCVMLALGVALLGVQRFALGQTDRGAHGHGPFRSGPETRSNGMVDGSKD